jgi:hypothetical protein
LGFTGNLKNLPLLEIMRIISLGQSTGSLIIRSPEGNGTVNFHLGEILYANIEGYSTRVGDVLMDMGGMTRDQLDRALAVQRTTKPWKPLGQICVEMGFVTLDVLTESIRMMFGDLVSEMANWRSGIFRFEEGKVAVSDQISFDIREVLLHSSKEMLINVEQFFMDKEPQKSIKTTRRSDGKRPAPSKKPLPPSSTPQESPSKKETEETDEAVEQFLERHPFREKEQNESIFKIYKEGAKLRRALFSLEKKRSQGEVSLLMLRFASEYLSRIILFVVREDQLIGLGQHGLKEDKEEADRIVRQTRIPLHGRVLSSLAYHAKAYRGPLEDSVWEDYLKEPLSNVHPEEMVFIPIVIGNTVRLVLYGDNSQNRIVDDLSNLRLFAQQVGMAFEIALLSQKK